MSEYHNICSEEAYHMLVIVHRYMKYVTDSTENKQIHMDTACYTISYSGEKQSLTCMSVDLSFQIMKMSQSSFDQVPKSSGPPV